MLIVHNVDNENFNLTQFLTFYRDAQFCPMRDQKWLIHFCANLHRAVN